jgi:gamma-D-glutamyl-L-lysine dipeptidyl-peptidase
MVNLFAFCSVSLSPLRENPSDSSEMTSQLVFGEIIQIIELDRQWRKVKSNVDNYVGWMDEKSLTILSESEMTKWADQQTLLYNPFSIIESKEGNIPLTKGSFVSKNGATFKIGAQTYKLLDEKIDPSNDLAEIAKSYLNAPYLWGGKTLFGMDCSGFTQMVYRFMGRSIPRDANLQSEEGETIGFENQREGDLAFFINDKGRIHHVGIILDENQIIHAHGWLRIDKMDETGIYRRNDSGYSHKLEFIKRYQ